jgi:hypothetical protein
VSQSKGDRFPTQCRGGPGHGFKGAVANTGEKLALLHGIAHAVRSISVCELYIQSRFVTSLTGCVVRPGSDQISNSAVYALTHIVNDDEGLLALNALSVSGDPLRSN